MTGDPLYRPLGMEPPPQRGRAARRFGRIVAAIVLLAGLGSAAAIVLTHRMNDDRRIAVVPIEVAPTRESAAPPSPAPAAVAAATPETVSPASTSGTTIEVQNGVKIIRFNGGASAGSVTIPVVGDEAAALAPAPDARVSEKTPEGTLPRIGPAGVRASAIYARRDPETKGPRIALVLLGLGRDPAATAEAVRQFAPAMSLGFAPEAGATARQVAEARRDGHEAFLDLRDAELPAGLRSGADPAQALRRRLGRWSGYVGVVLDPDAPTAVAEEAERRGVFSIAALPAAGPSVTRAADVLADAGQGEAALSAALARLVDIAKAKGSALGVVDHAANGGPGLMAALAGLGARRVTLVPASALLETPATAIDASR